MFFLQGQEYKPGATLSPGPLTVQTQNLSEWLKMSSDLCLSPLAIENSAQRMMCIWV